MEKEKVQVGKYTLESLTTGMYSDPKIVYREYIQNSVDSLETAVELGIIETISMRIDIVVNKEESFISVKDNGTGISKESAQSTLINIGNSKKTHLNNRGFRGIGRLGGMSYCDTLVFSTSAKGECIKTIISFDCKKLRELLVPGANEDMDLATVLNEVTTLSAEYEKTEKHYFQVDMMNVNSFSDLLDIDIVRSYISQVAPLAYKSRSLIYYKELHDFLSINGYNIEEFPIFVGESESELEPVYKPNKSHFHSDRNKMRNDDITKMRYFDITIDEELYALGWYGDCNWYGTLSDREITGFRVRKGNILIGDNKTLNSIFTEPRFNGWTQGEVFIITDKLIPNARRDNFEQNEYYFEFIKALSEKVGVEITKTIREASTTRNDPSSKVLAEVERQVAEATEALKEGFNSSIDKDKLIVELTQKKEELKKLKPKSKAKESLEQKKTELEEQLAETIETVAESKNFKINQINTGIDKKSKKILAVVTDILSEKLDKRLVDIIIDEIVKSLNKK